jgi:succinate dehydrogenase/fumarate reductase flavoprotein subunit
MADDIYDLIVVGSGAAGLTAATVAAVRGRRVLLIESGAQIGGTTAISGGMVWIPGNGKVAGSDAAQDVLAARQYLRSSLPNDADWAMVDAFLSSGPAAIRFLEDHTALRLQPVSRYPDYYPDRPGATSGGRVLEPVPFDGTTLGRHFAMLRDPLPEFTLFGGMMIAREDIPHFRKIGRSLASTIRVARLIARYARQRLASPRGTSLVLGNALVARLFRSAVDHGVTIWTGTAAVGLIRLDGRVRGVEIERSKTGKLVIESRNGVVLATGGLSHDLDLRANILPPAGAQLSATFASDAAKGGVRLAGQVGGAFRRFGNNAFWVPVSRFRRADGRPANYPHTVTDRGKPGLIAVNGEGVRFVNEALSYHEFGLAQLRASNRAIPGWLICDRRFLWRYGLGRIKPFTLSLGRYRREGYLKYGHTISALAEAIGLPPGRLEATVAAYNLDARQGRDTAFGKGSDIYQQHLGDAEAQPNPCLAPVEHAPFFACAVVPADLGIAAGLMTDPQARVLDEHGHAIPGLFACGNDMASVMAGAYPGPGITLGPALVFGYLAGIASAGE